MLIVALVVCAFLARKSKRAIANDVVMLLVALLPPMIGNSIIIGANDWLAANIGCYIYFIGLDFSVLALLRFTADYCDIAYVGTKWRVIVTSLVALDVLQLLLNPVTGHAFLTRLTMVDGSVYYQLVPLVGQYVHRVVAYGIFFVSVFIFAFKTFSVSRIYMEKYLVIFLSMVFVGLWETFYIFSGTPIDRSMIGFGVFGLLVFYFALYYKPMRLLDSMLARIVSSMNAAVFFFDTSGKCIYGNDAARSMVGLGRDEYIPEDVAKSISRAIGGWGGSYKEEWHVVRHVVNADEDHYLDVLVQQIYDERSRYLGAALSVRDITEDEKKLQREQFLANHDSLTGLFNQRCLFDRARMLIDEHPDTQYEVVGLDIKDFKIINDIFNKEFGDHVLCVMADAIRSNAVAGTVYGRLSGDKFGFVAPKGMFTAEQLSPLLDPQLYGEAIANYPIVVHVGVFEVADRELPVSVMFDRAFMAVKSIKHDYSRRIAKYDETMRDDLIWNQTISSQLEKAIRERQIRPYLQPMVDATGNIEGAEVLVRWVHPDEGFLSPARFIPVFENNGMVAQLDEYMWRCACEILRDWADRGIDLFLSVNISPKDFYFIDVFGTIKGLVQEYGIDPAKLRLEITETVMMTDLENRLRIIENLRAEGFLVEMDDFGSGYSSLNMLKDIPVDVLKIDMMFLYKTKDQSKAQTILQTIINLSGQLGIPSVTEGVETAEQLDMLVNMGCRMFQGYYFAKPMPVAEFEERFRAA